MNEIEMVSQQLLSQGTDMFQWAFDVIIPAVTLYASISLFSLRRFL